MEGEDIGGILKRVDALLKVEERLMILNYYFVRHFKLYLDSVRQTPT